MKPFLEEKKVQSVTLNSSTYKQITQVTDHNEKRKSNVFYKKVSSFFSM